MENDLVYSKGEQIFCDSRMVAEKFGKKHAYVSDAIRKLITDFEKIKGRQARPLIKETKGEYRGRKYVYYEMDKEFFSHLGMRFRGERAFLWQTKFVKAFFQMENALLQRSNLEWKKEREQGKQIRLDLTDVIKDFVDYATKQGSKSAEKYYSNISKMEYVALGWIAYNEKISDNFRNTLDVMELYSLLTAERVAKKALQNGMDRDLHYKDIFQLAKERVLQLADIMLIGH